MPLVQRGPKGIWHSRVRNKWKSLKTTNRRLAEIAHGKRLERYGSLSGGRITALPWAEFLEEYRAYSKAEKRESTCKSDKSILRMFHEIAGIANSRDITPRAIEQFKRKRAGTVTGRTVNRNLGLLLNMARFGQKEGYVDREHDFKTIEKLDEVKKRRVFYEMDEVRRIEAAIPGQPIRRRLIICGGLYSGMRSGELRELRVREFDFENGIIKITAGAVWRPKDDEERVVPLHEPFRAVVLEWIKKHNLDGADFVFAHYEADPRSHQKGRRMRTAYMNEKFKEFLRDTVGLVKGTYYSGRHTYATHFDGDVSVLQRILGHRSLETTMIYRHQLEEAIKKVAKKTPYQSV